MLSRRAIVDQLLLLAGFSALVVTTFSLYETPPAAGYEMSIYAAYPWYAWVSLGAALLAGSWVLARAAFSGSGRRTDRVYGLFLVFAALAVLLAIPYFRGYPVLGRGDVLTHVGYINSIKEFGTVGDQNIYPNFHLLVLVLSYATGVDALHSIYSLSVFASLFAVLSTVTLSSLVYGWRRALLTVPFTVALVTVIPVPYIFASLLLPFILFVLFQEQARATFSSRTVLALVVVSTVLYHPIVTLFLLFVFLIYALVRKAQTEDPHDSGGMPQSFALLTTVQLTVAVFISWYVSFEGVLTRFEDVFLTLLATSTEGSTLESYGSTISRTSPALVDIVQLLVVNYGASALMVSLGCVHVLYLLRRLYRTRQFSKLNAHGLTFAGGVMLFIGLSVAFLLMDFIVGFGRPLMYARAFGVFVAGALLFELYRTYTTQWHVKAGFFAVVVVLLSISVPSLYHSPYDATINHQVTAGELEGGEWLLSHRDPDLATMDHGLSLDRLRDANFGTRGYSSDLVLPEGRPDPPDRYNYTDHEYFGDGYDEDRYMAVTTAAREFYPKIYPDYREFWRYVPEDFDRLERDPTVAHIYDGGDFDAYRINGTQP